jgi:pimeloyl-ACP methyl ester carboxylesterase
MPDVGHRRRGRSDLSDRRHAGHRRRAPAQHVRFERIPKAGHFANEDDPERFFGLVREFVVT